MDEILTTKDRKQTSIYLPKNKKRILISFLLITVFLIFILYPSNKSYTDFEIENMIKNTTQEIVINNPTIMNNDAIDLSIQETAIKTKNKQLCNKINSTYIKFRCNYYFVVN